MATPPDGCMLIAMCIDGIWYDGVGNLGIILHLKINSIDAKYICLTLTRYIYGKSSPCTINSPILEAKLNLITSRSY